MASDRQIPGGIRSERGPSAKTRISALPDGMFCLFWQVPFPSNRLRKVFTRSDLWRRPQRQLCWFLKNLGKDRQPGHAIVCSETKRPSFFPQKFSMLLTDAIPFVLSMVSTIWLRN